MMTKGIRLLERKLPYNYQNLTNWRKHNLQTTNVHYNPNQLLENVAGRSNSLSGNVTIFPEGKNLDDVVMHEFSHSSDRPQIEINRHERAIPQRDADLMKKYKKSNAPDVNDDWINYVTEPTETRARLNSIRQQAKKQGVYDPFKEKITPAQYKKLLKTNSSEDEFNPLYQLKNAYRDTQIINLLNSVSQNEQSQQETPIAQNGKEMQYYQNGLDFKPKSISKNGSWLSKYDEGGIIKDDRGQWDHPGEITEINSNDITMEGVPYDVLGVSDTGDTKLMKPGKNYKFKGKKVTEFPMAQNGLRQEQKGLQNLDNLLNFTNYNKPQPGGWLNKYN
jgi:hypothetical protein